MVFCGCSSKYSCLGVEGGSSSSWGLRGEDRAGQTGLMSQSAANPGHACGVSQCVCKERVVPS